MIRTGSNYKSTSFKALLIVVIPLLLGNLTITEYGSLFSKDSYLLEDAETVPEKEQTETDYSEEEYLLQLSIILSKNGGQQAEMFAHIISEWMAPIEDILTPPPEFC